MLISIDQNLFKTSIFLFFLFVNDKVHTLPLNAVNTEEIFLVCL